MFLQIRDGEQVHEANRGSSQKDQVCNLEGVKEHNPILQSKKISYSSILF